MKKSIILLSMFCALFLSSCAEEIIELEVPVEASGDGNDPEPEPKGD